jgi:hypothetical protein
MMPWPFSAPNRALHLTTVAYGLLVISIGPVLLLIFPALPFANDRSCDAWYVYGLYFDAPEEVYWRHAARQIGRLTETLPGYFLTHTLPGIASDYAAFLLFFSLAVGFLYKAAALLFSRERAAFATAFFALSPVVIGNYAVTFSGPGITYEILALYCAVRAIVSATSRQLFAWMFLSGIAWGAALHAHLAVVAFSDFIYLQFALSIFLEFDRSLRSRIGSICFGAGATILGLAVLTAALTVFAVTVWHSSYSIALNQVIYISDGRTTATSLYFIADWYRRGAKVGAFLLGFGAAAICIVVTIRAMLNRGGTAVQRRGLATGISFALVLGILLVDNALGGFFLQYDYYYVFLWPFLALTLFALDIDRGFRSKNALLLVFVILCLLGTATKQYHLPQMTAGQIAAASITIASVASVFLLASQWTVRVTVAGAYLLLLASTTLFVRPEQMGAELWYAIDSPAPRRSYERINAGLKFLAPLFADLSLVDDVPKIWPDPNDPADGIIYAGAYLWCGYHPFPKIDPARWETSGLNFEPGDQVVIVARPENLFARAKKSLNDLFLEPTEVASKILVDEKGPYEILVVSVSKRQSP